MTVLGLEEAFSALTAEIDAESDPKALATTLLALNETRRLLAEIIDLASQKLYGAMEKKEMNLGAGIGVVQRNRETTVKWNHDALYDEIVRRHRTVDPDTGEVTVDGAALATDLKAVVAFSYWRKLALRARKIDPADFSSTSYGRPRIRFLSKEG